MMEKREGKLSDCIFFKSKQNILTGLSGYNFIYSSLECQEHKNQREEEN